MPKRMTVKKTRMKSKIPRSKAAPTAKRAGGAAKPLPTCPADLQGMTEANTAAKAAPSGEPGFINTDKPVSPDLLNQTTPLSRCYVVTGDLFDRLHDFAASRGTDVETLIRVATTAMMRAGKYYMLDTKLGFGKYLGETMEAVIRLDPGYVKWAVEKIEGLTLSADALALLDRITLAAVEGEVRLKDGLVSD